MNKIKTIKVRTLRRILSNLGCVPDRIRGSHEIWIAPSGRELPPVTINHKNADIKGRPLKSLDEALKVEGFNLEKLLENL